MAPSMGNIDVRYWSKSRLVEHIKDLENDIARKDATISDLIGRHAGGRVVVVPHKRKGHIDAIGKRHVRESLIDHITINLLSMLVTLPSAYATGEFTTFVIMQGIVNAVFGPLIKYLQKRNEEF